MRSTGPATRGSTGPSRSRSCPRLAATPNSASASIARRAPSRSSPIRTSARSTTSARGAPGRSAGPAFLVMEYSRARRWRTRLAQGRAAARTALRHRDRRSPTRWTRRTGTGIVHRDLKPGNVMLTKTRRQAARFRAGEERARRRALCGLGDAPSRPRPTPLTAAGHDPRDAPVHGAGADRRARGGRADRHLRVWLSCSTRCSPANRPSGAARLAFWVRSSRRSHPRSARCCPSPLLRSITWCECASRRIRTTASKRCVTSGSNCTGLRTRATPLPLSLLPVRLESPGSLERC